MAALALTGIVFVEVVASTIVDGIRDLGGAPAWALSWGTLVAIIGVAWFFVLLTLPRGVNDPGALLPGAIVVGVVQGPVQAVLQAYTEGRVARTTDTYGDLAVTLAILGNLFILGRIMTASFVVTAVTYERFGSLSEALFALPFVRRLPRRYRWLAEFFSLEVEGTEGDAARGSDRRREATEARPTRSSAHRLLGGRRRSASPVGVARLVAPVRWSRRPCRPARHPEQRNGHEQREPREPGERDDEQRQRDRHHRRGVAVLVDHAPRAGPGATPRPAGALMARSLPRRKATSARAAAMRSPTLTSRSSPSVSEVTISSSAARPPGLAARLGASSTTVRTRTRPTSEGRHHAQEQGDGGASPVRRQGGADAERHEREDDEGDDRPPEQREGVLGACHRGLAVRHVLAAVDHQLAEVVGQVAVDGVLELGDLLLGVTVGGELRQVDAGEDPAVLEPLEALGSGAAGGSP